MKMFERIGLIVMALISFGVLLTISDMSDSGKLMGALLFLLGAVLYLSGAEDL